MQMTSCITSDFLSPTPTPVQRASPQPKALLDSHKQTTVPSSQRCSAARNAACTTEKIDRGTPVKLGAESAEVMCRDGYSSKATVDVALLSVEVRPGDGVDNGCSSRRADSECHVRCHGSSSISLDRNGIMSSQWPAGLQVRPPRCTSAFLSPLMLATPLTCRCSQHHRFEIQFARMFS